MHWRKTRHSLTAANRNYKDPNHKPELVYALTEYQAMNGFRPTSEIISFFSELAIPELQGLVDDLIDNQTSKGLASFFSGLLSLEGEQKEMALTVLLAQARITDLPLFNLILELETQYPGDIGLFAPLLLNVITLKPGEAMFLDAETPHAYLKGTGLEIMANSDNVLRAGLTPKYMDVKNSLHAHASKKNHSTPYCLHQSKTTTCWNTQFPSTISNSRL